MNNTLSKVLVFVTGAAIGSLVTWKLIKTKYEKIADEEIESVREVYFKKLDKTKPEETDTDEVEEDESPEHNLNAGKPDLMEYAARLKNESYVDYSGVTKTEKAEPEDEKIIKPPYVISPEDVDEGEYNLMPLTYYPDGVLIDDFDVVIPDIENTVGTDFINRFGEYEKDIVYVRNDRLELDYEIVKGDRNYSSVSNDDESEMDED